MVRIFIADDHPLTRKTLKIFLEKNVDLRVVGEAGNGCDALNAISEILPDLVLLDIFMPRMTGFQVLEGISERKLLVTSLVISMFSDEMLVRQAVRLGARGYVLKAELPSELLPAIRCVMGGEYYFGSLISRVFVTGLSQDCIQS